MERILNRGGSADEVLSAVLEALQARGVRSGKVRLAKNGRLAAFVERVATLISPYVVRLETSGGR